MKLSWHLKLVMFFARFWPETFMRYRRDYEEAYRYLLSTSRIDKNCDMDMGDIGMASYPYNRRHDDPK